MKKDQYANFSVLYELEMQSPDTVALYQEWRESLKAAIKRYGLEVNTVIDLACGTGNTTIPWIEEGYRVIGVDGSPSMLRIAKKKSKKVKWMCQNLTQLNLREKAGVITCHYDALDHILVKADLLKVFCRVHRHLVDGGLFQFDMNTEHWFRWLSVREKLFSVGKHYFMASNLYDPKTRIAEFRQLWFVREKNRFKKIDVRVKERPYTKAEVMNMLKQCGLRLLSMKVQRKIEGKPSRLLWLVRK